MQRHEEIAERIVVCEALAFALAAARVAAGDSEPDDLRVARVCLKAAISRALAAEQELAMINTLEGNI